MDVGKAFAEIAAGRNVIPEERMRVYDEVFNRGLGITFIRHLEDWASQQRLVYVPEKN